MIVAQILEEKGRNVLTMGPSSTLREAAKLLHAHHVGAVIITDPNGQIHGILAERDIVATVATKGPESLDKPLSSVMWKKVYRCTEETTVEQLMQMMSAHRARHIPVEKEGRLVGIISIGDVVKAHIRDIKDEAEQIKAYIAG